MSTTLYTHITRDGHKARILAITQQASGRTLSAAAILRPGQQDEEILSYVADTGTTPMRHHRFGNDGYESKDDLFYVSNPDTPLRHVHVY